MFWPFKRKAKPTVARPAPTYRPASRALMSGHPSAEQRPARTDDYDPLTTVVFAAALSSDPDPSPSPSYDSSPSYDTSSSSSDYSGGGGDFGGGGSSGDY